MAAEDVGGGGWEVYENCRCHLQGLSRVHDFEVLQHWLLLLPWYRRTERTRDRDSVREMAGVCFPGVNSQHWPVFAKHLFFTVCFPGLQSTHLL